VGGDDSTDPIDILMVCLPLAPAPGLKRSRAYTIRMPRIYKFFNAPIADRGRRLTELSATSADAKIQKKSNFARSRCDFGDTNGGVWV
jgi:hypothetical protein